MRQRKTPEDSTDQGYILVFVLGLLVTLGLLLGDVSTRSHLGGRVLLNSAAQIEKRFVTSGGVEIGIAALGQYLARGHAGGSLPQFEARVGEKDVIIEVEDECGKLNLRTADTGTMARLFQASGFDRETAKEMALSILYHRGGTGQTKRVAAGSLETLLSLDGFDAVMMKDLGHLVSFHCPRRGVSVWSAPQAVLESLPGADRSAIARFVEERSSDRVKERGLRVNLGDLSRSPGRLSTSVGPIYTIRSRFVDNGKSDLTQEQLIFVGGYDISKRIVLRTTFPANQGSAYQ